MNLLLDTHVLLWWLADETLDVAAAQRIADPEAMVAVSSASIWEISIKQALGKLRFDGSIAAAAGGAGGGGGWAGAALAPPAGGGGSGGGPRPPHHRDPFDRLLIAQAQIDGF